MLVVLHLLAFLLVALLLAITMFALIALADLEHDLANPHDTTSKLNALSKPEVALQGALTLVSLVTQGWVSLACSLPVAVYHGRRYLRSDLEFDVTEIFSTLSREKRDRLIKLVLYMVVFIMVVFRLTEAALTSVASKHGTEAAKRLVQESASAIM